MVSNSDTMQLVFENPDLAVENPVITSIDFGDGTGLLVESIEELPVEDLELLVSYQDNFRVEAIIRQLFGGDRDGANE